MADPISLAEYYHASAAISAPPAGHRDGGATQGQGAAGVTTQQARREARSLKALVMFRRRMSGETLEEIAREYGVTRERIRQQTAFACRVFRWPYPKRWPTTARQGHRVG